MSRFLCLVLSLGILSGCAETRVKKYQDFLEPRMGKASKRDIDKILGSPSVCVPDSRYQRCEYRTAAARNAPVSGIYRKEPGMGPDLTPYDQYDVLHVFYDATNIMQEWKPVSVPPQ